MCHATSSNHISNGFHFKSLWYIASWCLRYYTQQSTYSYIVQLINKPTQPPIPTMASFMNFLFGVVWSLLYFLCLFFCPIQCFNSYSSHYSILRISGSALSITPSLTIYCIIFLHHALPPSCNVFILSFNNMQF